MKKISDKTFTMQGKLTEEQIIFFKRNGYLHFRNFIDTDTVSEFLNEIKKTENYLLQNGIKKVNGIPLKFGVDTNGESVIQRLAFTSQYSERLHLFLRDPRLKFLLALLGRHDGRIGEYEKDGLVVNHYINTTGSSFNHLGWHTDSPRDIFLGSKIQPMLNVGLHLDDCAAENGGLKVIPGTHTQSLFNLFFRKKYFVDNSADKNEVGFDIKAGDLTIHDGRIWHRVQQSSFIGEKSRRRVMYIPIITGAYKPKDAQSATPLYHKIAQMKWNGYGNAFATNAIKN